MQYYQLSCNNLSIENIEPHKSGAIQNSSVGGEGAVGDNFTKQSMLVHKYNIIGGYN